MAGWKTGISSGLVLLLCMLCSCASDPGFTAYRQGMFYGTEALQNGDNATALQQFLKASQGEPDKRMPLALAGQAAYQLGDYGNASQYLARAATLDPNQSSPAYVIISGYQALIAYREGRRDEGMAALAYYLKLYRHSYPDRSLEAVSRMYDTGDINIPALEMLINQEMLRYEKEFSEFD